jgi:CubicO group peptidase (beta-lactamase class C family)
MLRYLSAALTLILLSLVPCVPLPGLGDAPPEKPDQALRDILEPIRKKHDLPALAAAFVRSKGLVAAAAVGVRRRGTDIAVTADDQFHLGSDTKLSTCCSTRAVDTPSTNARLASSSPTCSLTS